MTKILRFSDRDIKADTVTMLNELKKYDCNKFKNMEISETENNKTKQKFQKAKYLKSKKIYYSMGLRKEWRYDRGKEWVNLMSGQRNNSI